MFAIELVGRVRNNLSDAGIQLVEDGEILDAINDAYNEIVLLAQGIEKSATLPFKSGLVYYDFYNAIPDYFKTLSIFNPATNRWLECKSDTVFNKFRIDWEVSSGTPWFYNVKNFQYVSFFPHYPSAAQDPSITFDMLYKACADTLTLKSIPQIPEQYQSLLEFFATAECLEIEKKYNNANIWWEKYEERLGRYIVEIPQRIGGDKILTLGYQEDSSIGY